MVRVGRWSIVAVLLWAAGPLMAQHGRFDQTPINPADEALIFTPPGFDQPGKVAIAPEAESALLNVTIVDAATGKPTACRVNVVGADGNFYQPSENPLGKFSLNERWPDSLAGNRPGKAPIRYFGHFFYTTGTCAVRVPPGKVRLEVWKGFEYLPVTREIDVAAGPAQDVRIELKCEAPLAAGGWYSGDPHLHFIRASESDDETIFDLLEAEDIRLGMILCYNEPANAYPGVMPEMATPQLRGLGRPSVRQRGQTQIISGQEYRNGVFGHMNIFLRNRLVLEGQRLDSNLGPVFGKLATETRQQGGYSFHAHGGYAQEIWADLVHGATQGVELLQFGIYRGIGLEGWYHVLSAGFRFPGVGACDYPACRKLGDARTYVYIDGPPTFDAWLRGAAEGRSFMTTGPLVMLEVDGRRPGETIALESGKSDRVKIRVNVRSETAPVTHVQIVVGGRVVAEHVQNRQTDGTVQTQWWIDGKETDSPSSPGVAPGRALELELPFTVTDSTWVAARAFSKSVSGSADAEAHTNPVYLQLDDKSPRHAADIAWLGERLDELIADQQARTAPEKAAAIEYFNQAKQKLATLTAEHAPGAESAVSQGAPVGTQLDESLADILKPVPALSPEQAEKSFEVSAGFRMQLVAHEPDVTDPVAACFDENGGMYVCEMIDYPYRPKEGQAPLGRIRYLRDDDGDGVYEKSWIFADQLVWPTGAVCWQGGIYVAAAPDLWYLKDTDGDHRADVREKVFTGFGDRNQQGMFNNLNWHVDHKIYGSGSTNGGAVRRGDKPDMMPIVLSGRDFRFEPRTHQFETVSGSQQFGNAFDDSFNRFLCDESGPVFHVVLPQHYLARNPHLAVPSAIHDLAPGVTPIFRISPIERWREIRSNRRLAAGERSPKSAGLSHNVIDAAAGLTIYRGHAYPAEYRGNVFVGCSQNNLVHRRTLTPEGATFRSQRADENTEFVRTPDIWFRPVNCINAPDGTLYILDMSREVIESVHIANDVVAHLDLTSGRDKGRIYRLAPPGFKVPPAPRLGQATTAELVATLEHPGGWWRDTASRLLFERQDPLAVDPLRRLLNSSESSTARLHALWALDGLAALTERDVLAALSDPAAMVREHALRLAEPRLAASASLRQRVIAMAHDADPRVRFQTAFTLGEIDDPAVVPALGAIALQGSEDTWLRTAVLSSVASRSGALLGQLTSQPDFLSKPAAAGWVEQLAAIVGSRRQDAEVVSTLDIADRLGADSPLQLACVLGLGSGLQRASGSLHAVRSLASPPAARMLDHLSERASATVHDAGATAARQTEALRYLGYDGSAASQQALQSLLDPRYAESIQIIAVRTLARGSDGEIARALTRAWSRMAPKVQEEILTALSSRKVWSAELLAACRDGSITASQVSHSTRTALLNHSDAALREQATQLFGEAASPRHEVIARYQEALSLPGEATRGEAVYQRECMICHRLGDRGFQVGPNLALIRNRTPAALLEAVLDPNREVQPSFVNYVLVDASGRTLTGLIQSETASSITLVRDKGVTETVQKQNVEEIHSTGKSLMPEGLDKTIDPQAMADLLAFLKQVQYDIGTLPDFRKPNE